MADATDFRLAEGELVDITTDFTGLRLVNGVLVDVDIAAPGPGGSGISLFQGPNLGADLFDGTLL